MKASEVIQRYKTGERNFQGVKLRGQSFRGENLSNANFSKADIRGASFSNASLQNTDFSGAIVGRLRHYWIINFVLIICFAITGFIIGFSGLLSISLLPNNIENNVLSIIWPRAMLLFFVLIIYAVIYEFNEIIATMCMILIIAIVIGLVTIGHWIGWPFALIGSFFLFQGWYVLLGKTGTGTGSEFLLIFSILISGIFYFVALIFPLIAIFQGSGSFALAISLILSTAISLITFSTGVLSLAFLFTIALIHIDSKLKIITLFSTIIIAISSALVSVTIGLEVFVFDRFFIFAQVLTGIAISIRISQYTLKGYERFFALLKAAITLNSIGGTSFRTADLTYANFTGVKFRSTNFRNASIKRTRWYKAEGLDKVRGNNKVFANKYIQDNKIQKLVTTCKGEYENLSRMNLHELNFENASFINTDFTDANLNQANLKGANLSQAKLVRAQLDSTDLSQACLTGACIEDWKISNKTNLDKVICDYIYLKAGQQERRPSNPNRNFEPGEFAKLVDETRKTVDLIFSKGVDLKALAYSWKNTQVLNEDTPLAIQSIEDNGDGDVLIKVNVPQNADKDKIKGDFWQGYEFAKETLKEQFDARLLDKDTYIKQLYYSLNQAQEKLGEVPRLMAEQPKFQQNFNAPVYGVAGNVEGNQNIYASQEKQTLAEAAEEIQNLLKQLEQTNPTATVKQQQAYVDAAISPTIKQRCVGALKAGGETAIEEFLDNPYVNVGKAVIKGWLKPE